MTAPTQPAPLDLDALERLHQAATPGRWDAAYLGRDNAHVYAVHKRDEPTIAVHLYDSDATFIVSAHKNMPALLAEARENRTSRNRIAELERENAELRDALKPFADLGEAHDEVWFEEKDNSACFRIGPYRLEAGHLRRAARLVSEPRGKEAPKNG